jgi:hypothetical protein
MLDETRMDHFLISLSHPCMHGRGSTRVLEGVVELRTRPLVALRVTRGKPNGSAWLMPLLDHPWHWSYDGVDSCVGFLYIDFVSLVYLQCVQQFGSDM